MQVQDFNRPAASPAADPPPPPSGRESMKPAEMDRDGIEMALLRAQIEHLELVVETARSLMTNNQERLLRRLHDLPGEMVALTARLNRLDRNEPVRRVA
jgi:hypothetical protein